RRGWPKQPAAPQVEPRGEPCQVDRPGLPAYLGQHTRGKVVDYVPAEVLQTVGCRGAPGARHAADHDQAERLGRALGVELSLGGRTGHKVDYSCMPRIAAPPGL